MKIILISLIALGTTCSVFAQEEIQVNEGLDVETVLEGPFQAKITNKTIIRSVFKTTGTYDAFITANNENAHMLCISNGFDKAISFKKLDNFPTLVQVESLLPDGTARMTHAPRFNERALAEVKCTIKR